MDLSLLVHTCDNYFRYWPGMLFSLDFNWDYSRVPVYWASEELSIHEQNFQCRGLKYTPNKEIRQILTGRTDRNGFSTRMRIAIENISTKWVIYMQEDMWLLSAPSYDLLSKLVLLAELKEADSIKIHTKLHYYDSYVLEPTSYEIHGNTVLKYSQGRNYLHSHNATIWNREYLLQNLKDGEDPWTNEIEGSKRMSSKPNNHFHYNIHWYSQPGVCERGEDSRDFFTLAPIFDDRMNLKLHFEKK
jgi:hypothetical protein